MARRRKNKINRVRTNKSLVCSDMTVVNNDEEVQMHVLRNTIEKLLSKDTIEEASDLMLLKNVFDTKKVQVQTLLMKCVKNNIESLGKYDSAKQKVVDVLLERIPNMESDILLDTLHALKLLSAGEVSNISSLLECGSGQSTKLNVSITKNTKESQETDTKPMRILDTLYELID